MVVIVIVILNLLMQIYIFIIIYANVVPKINESGGFVS